MTENDAEFLKRLLETFRVEAQEHLNGMRSALLELEKCGGLDIEPQLIETVFREAHSLKGAARAVNLTGVERLCQTLESVFASMKKKQTRPSAGLFDVFHQTLDFLAGLLPVADGEGTSGDRALLRDLVARLKAVIGEPEEEKAEEGNERRGEPEPAGKGRRGNEEPLAPLSADPGWMDSPSAACAAPLAHSETLRVSSAKLAQVLLQSEEMLSAKLAAAQRALDMRTNTAVFDQWKKQWGKIHPLAGEIRSGMRPEATCGGAPAVGINQIERLLDFLDWNASFVRSLETVCVSEAKSALSQGRALGGMVDNLLKDMKKVMMFPFASLLEILPKLVRDLARDSGKEVDLHLRGEEIEIDRRILEEMKDPLVHLVRNCIDHALEKPEDRKRKNKPPRGTIRVTVAPRDDKVEMVIADDGAGISPAQLRSALLKLGAIPQERLEELTDRELLPFVFDSGVSTSPIITELSGRGLGLAIVREKVEKLGGSVSVNTQPDAGTRFHILLPLTFATFRGILVRVAERTFVIPSMHVQRAVRFQPEDIRTVENRGTLTLNDHPISLARLSDILEIPPTTKVRNAANQQQAVVLSAAGTSLAFVVDEVIKEQEVLLKGLGPQLSRVRNLAGATILGNGKIAPVLNVVDLIKTAVRASGSSAPALLPGMAETPPRKRSVMVAEDSITTRTLLKNILETAGYEVVTAVDGLDALNGLKSGMFDILVSDVDMPRMNGFDLTAKIRGDKTLKDLPVVLVTALESRPDRERGIDVGANAYIVKGSFDQSNLLEVMKKLL